jgi:hypothetical protein
MLAAAVGIVLMGIVHMAGIVAGAADGLAAAEGIVDAAGAVDGLGVADGIVGAAALAGDDTKNSSPRIYTDRSLRVTIRVVAFFRGRETQPLGLKPGYFMLSAALKRRSSTALPAVVEGHLE